MNEVVWCGDQAQTSIDAFHDKLEDGSLTDDQEEVLKLVANHGPTTLKDVAEIMGRYPNQVSGRFTELRDQGLIKVVGRDGNHRVYEVVDV